MKKMVFILVLTVLALAATTAFAQVNFTLRAHVPMAFSVDGERYPAGPYELRILNSNIAQLVNMNTGYGGLFMLNPEQASNGGNRAPVLRFIVNGKRAYLTSLTDGEGNGWHVHVAEKDLEASGGSESKTTVVALK